MPACLWVQAGVVAKKSCPRNFQCNTCPFDRALRLASRKNREMREQGKHTGKKSTAIIFWKDKLRQQPPARRPCVHYMKGQLGFRLCHQDYNCPQCEFDQYFYDQHTVYAVMRPVDLTDIGGVKLPRGYYLHKAHTWAKLEDDKQVRIGLDDFARRLLGPPHRIEVPLVGKTVARGRTDITLHRTINEGNLRAGFASPVSGVVTAVNTERMHGKAAGEEEAYANGWLLLVHSNTLRQDLASLLFMDEAEDYMTREVHDFYEILERQTGLMAANAGPLGEDIVGHNPHLDWDSLVDRFFR